MAGRSIRSSFRRRGTLVPQQARGLRARCVNLKPGAVMPWHTTGKREELLIVLSGRVHLETKNAARRIHTMALQAGQCAFVPSHTIHQVVNPSRTRARYLYVTAPTPQRKQPASV